MKHIEVKATVACWITNSVYGQREFRDALDRSDSVAIADSIIFYGAPDKDKFGEYVRIGEADVTMRFIPKDEQTRIAVQALQTQLAEERVKWHQRQESILAEISKLQALTFEAP